MSNQIPNDDVQPVINYTSNNNNVAETVLGLPSDTVEMDIESSFFHKALLAIESGDEDIMYDVLLTYLDRQQDSDNDEEEEEDDECLSSSSSSSLSVEEGGGEDERETSLHLSHHFPLTNEEIIDSVNVVPPSTIQFFPKTKEVVQKLHLKSFETTEDEVLPRALLFSNFEEGILPSHYATRFLKNSVYRCMIHQQIGRIEDSFLNDDDDDGSTQSLISKLSLDLTQELHLRMVYISTAKMAVMPHYASPQKEEERKKKHGEARKRRNTIEKYLKKVMGAHVQIDSVMLDLHNWQKIKTNSTNNDEEYFPQNGKEALTHWKPHIIYVEGGNTFWLRHCISKGGWTQLIRDACFIDNAVYLGRSAGAINSCKLVEMATWKKRDNPKPVETRPKYRDWIGEEGLSMLGNVSIFPHMEEKWKEVVLSKMKELSSGGEDSAEAEVVCLTDQEVLCVDGTRRDATLVSYEKIVGV